MQKSFTTLKEAEDYLVSLHLACISARLIPSGKDCFVVTTK